ncbi:hypothetical protein FPV67DRAFT_607951 [Lyophyllum atratum]|nr:hypothetical protein FPV67DRAFT_607951 [Lyophyllum atratum]
MNVRTLPIELIEKIILDAWSSPLSADDRVTFMTSSLLVNKTWMALFIRISFRDVHIPCPSYLEQYMRTLAGCSSIFDEQSKSLPSILCHSVTVKIRVADTCVSPIEADEDLDDPPMGKTLGKLLYELNSCHVPNLRTLYVEYENMGFDDIFDRWRFTNFPTQITNLEISFAFDRAMAALGGILRAIHERQDPYVTTKVYMPSIKQLRFSGASKAFMEDMAVCCINAETPVILPARMLPSVGSVVTTSTLSSSSWIAEPTSSTKSVACIGTGGLRSSSKVFAVRILGPQSH